MKKLIIGVGTNSKLKIIYLEEVLRELNIKAQIIPSEVESGIPLQPFNSKNVKQGSINRAKKILAKTKADLGIGIEVGYHKNPSNKYEMLCWATIIDKKDYQISAKSHQFLLPKYHQKILKQNKYLGNHVRDYVKTSKDRITREIGIIIRDRKPFIKNATRHVLIYYFANNEFEF